ncbi:MAG: FAD-dependent oxidoreductase [Thermodesulfobacteriota bacterium]
MELIQMETNWDLVIIGGGVTGAGVFREAVRSGLKVLLVEKKDFAWGTSSRSSKMVHGGLRYLKEGKFLLTRTSVRERERLLNEAPGLVEPLEILVPVYSDHGPGKRSLEIGLSIYGLMASEKQHSYLNPKLFRSLLPDIKEEHLVGGFRFWDAKVDDARLVLRLIEEGVARGGTAVNYMSVEAVLRNAAGAVAGLALKDTETGVSVEINTSAVVNATGVWAEKLHPSPREHLHLRPLRGSHLIFPYSALPVAHTVSFFHPADKRPVFISPWEGVVLLGTTDIDHDSDLDQEPATTMSEARYLMEGLHWFFPSFRVGLEQAIACLAGVRPVLSEGKLAPSKESRENVVWVDKGLITVTGGKLTTFRKMAVDTLKAARPFIPNLTDNIPEDESVFAVVPEYGVVPENLTPSAWRRLCGRYGHAASDLVRQAELKDLEVIPGTETLWAELPFVAGREKIRHLADLLLRRVRIGILTPEGGFPYMERIQGLCQPKLTWDERRWEAEKQAYAELHRRAHVVNKE